MISKGREARNDSQSILGSGGETTYGARDKCVGVSMFATHS